MHRMAAMSQISWLRWVSRSSPHSEPKTVRDCSIYLQAKKALNGRERKQDSPVSIWAKHDKLRSHFHVFWKFTKIFHLILRQKPPDLVLQAWQQQKKRLRRSSRCIFAACFHSSESSFGLESIFSGSWHGSSLIGIAPVSVTFGGQSNWMTSAGFFNLQKLDWLAAATNSDQIKRRQHYSTTYFFLNSPPDQDSQDIRDTTSWISVQIPGQLVAISKHSRPGNAVSQHPRWTCVSCLATPGSLSKQIA